MSFKPLSDNVLVEQQEAKLKLRQDLSFLLRMLRNYKRATVVAVGPGKRLKDDKPTMSYLKVMLYLPSTTLVKLNLDGKDI